MNYAEARQQSGSGGWHFTVRNDDRIWPHECCRTLASATDDDVRRYEELGFSLTVDDLIPGEPHDPHATREEAEACFHAWQLRQAEDWKEIAWGGWTDCAIDGCDNPTRKGASWRNIGGPEHEPLCDDHLNNDGVRTLAESRQATRVIYS